MKKILLSAALIAATAVVAQDYKYELSPMVGYNFAEGNLGMKNDGYFVGGLELQFNTPGSKLSPEVSVYVAPGADYARGGDTNVYRGAFNAVYTFDAMDNVVPFAKLGGGLEKLSTERYGNEDDFFLDAGAGLKVPFTENLAFKLEAIYMAKINHNHAGHADSNLMTLAGLTYSFGEVAKAAPAVVAAAPVVVDGDDDNDGVKNSQDKCANTPANTPVDTQGCALPQDDDKDGVFNDADKCPNTPAGITVDASGCDADLDKDGVINANDICPNTPLNTAVNSDGCAKTVNLHINFANNSYKVKQESLEKIINYAKFLKAYPNYSAHIVGYTDSRGSAKYNQKLSEKRAYEVRRLLIANGVNPSQVTAEGRGEANPIASNDTAEGRAQNRRIEAELSN